MNKKQILKKYIGKGGITSSPQSGKMYPAVEGPGNPSWEKRTGYGQKGLIGPKFTPTPQPKPLLVGPKLIPGIKPKLPFPDEGSIKRYPQPIITQPNPKIDDPRRQEPNYQYRPMPMPTPAPKTDYRKQEPNYQYRPMPMPTPAPKTDYRKQEPNYRRYSQPIKRMPYNPKELLPNLKKKIVKRKVKGLWSKKDY